MKTMCMVFFASVALLAASLGDVTPIGADKAVSKLKKDPKIVVVDLRTPKEFAKGHIQGAINIDVKDKKFAEKLGKLDRKTTYIMHCRSGSRSAASIPVWNNLRFEKVLHLTSGALGWQKAGEKLVASKPEAATK